MLLVAALMVAPLTAFAEDEAEAGDGPPLPLHTIEGVGGIVLTPMAYLVNPGPPGTVIGKPAVAAHWALLGGKDLEAITFTWTLWRRLELGYAFNRLGLDDFGDDVRAATGLDIRTNDILLHHFNARLNVIEENAGDMGWVPAVTLGAHYKYNNDVHEINRRLMDTLNALGYDDNDGVDFTLTATKALAFLPRPVFFSAGARCSRAAHLGFLGFTNDYFVTLEGSALMLVTDRLAVGAEYRQKPDDLVAVPGLLANEDSWWDVHAAYILSNNAVVYATVGGLGKLLNHSDETLYGLVFKYEF